MTATNVHDKSSTKGDGAMTPHDRNAETNLQRDPRKRSASYDGNTGDKSRKQLRKATRIKIKTQAQMKRLGMVNV